MSWDVYFVIDTGGVEPATVGESYNMTWNVSPMYDKAFAPSEEGLCTIENKIAGDMIPILRDAIKYMQDNSKEMKVLHKEIKQCGECPYCNTAIVDSQRKMDMVMCYLKVKTLPTTIYYIPDWCPLPNSPDKEVKDEETKS